MKQFYFIAVFLFTFGVFSANAQDLIVLKNGNIIEAKVTEISPSEIRYLRYDHLDGPVIVVLKADVFSIRYENGRVEIMDDTPISSPSAPSAEEGPIVTSVRVIPEDAVVTRGWTQKFTAIVNDDQSGSTQTAITVQSVRTQAKDIPARPQLGPTTALQRILNGLPAVSIAGRTLKFTFGGNTWIASFNGKEILGGTITIKNTDEGNILTLQQTHTRAFVWIKTPGPEIVLEYKRGPPASLALSSRSQNSEQTQQNDNTETSDPLRQVIWSVSGSENEGTFISSGGVLTVAEDEMSEELIVQATSVHDAETSGTVTVTLQTSTVAWVSISSGDASVARGGSRRFFAEVTGTNNPPQDVTWTVYGSSNPKTFISSDGILTIASDETSFELRVAATSKFNTRRNGIVYVTISPVNWLSAEASVLGGGLRYERSINNFFSRGINGFYQGLNNDIDLGILAITKLFTGDSPFFFELGIGYGYMERSIEYNTPSGNRGELVYKTHGIMINPAVGVRYTAKGFFFDLFVSAPIVFGQKKWVDFDGGPDGAVTPSIRYGIGMGGAW